MLASELLLHQWFFPFSHQWRTDFIKSDNVFKLAYFPSLTSFLFSTSTLYRSSPFAHEKAHARTFLFFIAASFYLFLLTSCTLSGQLRLKNLTFFLLSQSFGNKHPGLVSDLQRRQYERPGENLHCFETNLRVYLPVFYFLFFRRPVMVTLTLALIGVRNWVVHTYTWQWIIDNR